MTQSELNTLIINTLSEVIPLLPEGKVKVRAYNTLWVVCAYEPVVPIVVHSSNLPLMEEVKDVR